MRVGPWWRIGWRNVARHRRRTALTASALAVGYAAVMLMVGWMDGIIVQMVDNGTGLLTGQLQVQDQDYLPERSLYNTIGGRDGIDVQTILDVLRADPGISAATPRVYVGALLSSGEATTAVMVMGIDDEQETAVARLAGSLVRGRSPRPGANEVVIGEGIVRKLGSDLGDEIVLVAPAADGSMGNDLFTVTGVFSTGLALLDRAYALAPIDAVQALVALEANRVHEIAAAIDDPWTAPEVADRINARLTALDLGAEVRPWTTYRPEIVDYARLARGSFWVIILIVFGMAAFGVANTMLVATFERRREFALLMALGARPNGVVRSLAYEAFSLGVVSLAAGIAVAAPLMIWFHNAPPDLTSIFGGFTFAGAFLRPVLRVEYSMSTAVWSGLALLLTSVLAGVYPALKAARTPPADTLQGR
ncbi:MAG: ABC transporter permease [Gemmatimonadetes bacterium]|nr:ABC transporter permease [Gemmatimonadota bacterium]